MGRSNPRVVVLGGGLSGAATAYTLARAGVQNVTLVERGERLGGLAGSFERQGHVYPLGYHHILPGDRVLLRFLDRIGVSSQVRWRRIRMLFRTDGRTYDLSNPSDLLGFPMPTRDKVRFVSLMLRAFAKRDWSDWEGRSAEELVDAWAGPRVRRALFEPLCDLKFELPCSGVSAAWLGARLHFREGSTPLGYVPGADWTRILCDGMTRLVSELGVQIRTSTTVEKLVCKDGLAREVVLSRDESLPGDFFVSTLPTEVYLRLVAHDDTPQLESIRYTALLSSVFATQRRFDPDFYWLNLASPRHTTCGVFLLSSLNPTIGGPGESCVNFVTHLRSRHDSRFRLSDAALIDLQRQDCKDVFGFDLDPVWAHVSRVPMYSPIFTPSFRNPPLRSSAWPNVYFAGNYRTFPSVASTGTALGSGVEAGCALLKELGVASELQQR